LTSKPSVEENWYREMKRLGVGYQVDLCPESGNCRMNVTKLSELQRIGIVRARWLRDTSAVVRDALDDARATRPEDL